MMESLQVFAAFIATCVVGIMVLAVFFQGLAMLNRKLGPTAEAKMKEVLDPDKWFNVHLAGGKVMECMQFEGFTEANSFKGGHIPYQLSNMIILKNAAGRSVLLRSDAVKMLEEVAAPEGSKH